jgi:hypothetical protein
MIDLDFTNTDEVKTEFGWYHISASPIRPQYYASREFRVGFFGHSLGVPDDSCCSYANRELAIEACQKDYRRRVKATIEQAYGKRMGVFPLELVDFVESYGRNGCDLNAEENGRHCFEDEDFDQLRKLIDEQKVAE